MKSFFDLAKYAHTGIASPGMTAYDKTYAISAFGSKFPITTLTGVDQITFDSDGKPLTAWGILANMVQDGTPTPSSIIVPQEFGDRTGNLWDENYPNISGTIRYIPIYVGDGSFTLSTTTPYDSSVANVFLLSGNVSAGASTSGNGAWLNHSVTAQSDSGYVTIAYRHYTGTTSPADCKTMLNLGSTALDYEPFGYKIPISCGGQTYNVYLSEPLRKIGDYADTISSDGTVTRAVKKFVLTGEEGGTWSKNSIILNGDAFFNPNIFTGYNPNKSGYCSHLQTVTTTAATQGAFWGGNINFILDFSMGIDTTIKFKAYLMEQYAAGTPVTVWYVLAEPTTETVTVPTITPAKGENTLSIDTELPPSEVSITGHIKAV